MNNKIKKIISVVLAVSILSLSAYASGIEADNAQSVNGGPTALPPAPDQPEVVVESVLSGLATIIGIITGITSIAQYLTGNGNTNSQTIYGYVYSIMTNMKSVVQGLNWFAPNSGTLGLAITGTKTYLQNIYNKLPSSWPNYSQALTDIKGYTDGIEGLLTTNNTYLLNNGTSLGYINSNIVSGNNTLSNISGNIGNIYTRLGDILDDTSELSNLDDIVTNTNNLSSIKTNTDNLGSIKNSLINIDGDTTTIHTDIGEVSDGIDNLSDSLGYSSSATLATSITDISDKESDQIDLLEDIVDVLANQQDQTIVNNSTNNKNTIVPLFFNTSIENNTSLHSSDFTGIASVLSALRDLFKAPNISISQFGSALEDAEEAGTSFFSQAVYNDLNGIPNGE